MCTYLHKVSSIYLQSVLGGIWTCDPAVAAPLSSSALNLFLPVICRNIFSSDCSHLLWRSSTTSFVKPLQLPTFHTSPNSFLHNDLFYVTYLCLFKRCCCLPSLSNNLINSSGRLVSGPFPPQKTRSQRASLAQVVNLSLNVFQSRNMSVDYIINIILIVCMPGCRNRFISGWLDVCSLCVSFF